MRTKAVVLPAQGPPVSTIRFTLFIFLSISGCKGNQFLGIIVSLQRKIA
jgi:hypothetical protein